MKRDHPCAKDCPRRSAECRLSCPEWVQYVEKRDSDYKREHAANKAETGYIETVVKRMDRCNKINRRKRR